MGTDRPGVTRPSWLAEPHERQRVGCVETLVTVFGFWLPGAGGFDSGRSFVAARLNRLRGEDAHVLAQPALFWWKLVEPACERQRVGRVETSCACPGNLGGFWLPGVGWCRFGSLVCRGPAQLASKGGGLSARSSPGFCLMYTHAWFLARRYLAQFPQGRKAARVSELFRVREGPFSFAAARIRDAGLATSPRDPPLGFGSGCSLAFTARLNQLCGRRGRLWGNRLPGRRGRRESVGGLQYS